LLVLLLSIPVQASFSSGDSPETRKTTITVKWLFGLIRFRLSPKRRERREPGKAKRRPGVLAVTLRTPGFVPKLLSLGRDLLHVVHVRWLRVDLKVGLSDPADTGMLAGGIMPAMALIHSYRQVELNIEPDFRREGLALQVNGEAGVYPIALIIPLLRFVFSRPTLRVARTAVMG